MGLPIGWQQYVRVLDGEHHAKTSTLKTHHSHFIQLERYFADKEYTHDTIIDFLFFKKSQGIHVSTLNCYLQIIQNIDSIAGKEEAKGIERYKVPRIIRDTLTPEEQQKIICCEPHTAKQAKETNERYSVVIECLLSTGLRISELLNLRVQDIQGEHIIIRDTKTNEDRVAIISKRLAEKMLALIRYDDHVFSTIRGPLRLYYVDQEIHLRARLCGIKKNLASHSMRRTAATEAHEHGADLYSISKFLGHRSVDTTSRYIQSSDKDLKLVASSLSINKDMQTLERVYERVRQLGQEFISNFKVELKKTKSGVRLFISD